MTKYSTTTEEILNQTLHQCYEEQPTARCLQLKFSQFEEDIDCDIEQLSKDLQVTMREFLGDPECRAFLCHDNDIFLITKALTRKRLEDFIEKFFAHLSPQLTPASIMGLAALFEVGVDWPRLRMMCKKKMEALALLKAEKMKPKETLKKINTDEMFGTLDADLISSLAMRREARNQPEIMVVEDDPFSQKLVGNALKKTYSLSMTADGQGAILNYINKAPDVLFLDIGLPDMDGHQVLEKLFQIDPSAYVVMFSGNGDKDNILRAVELGAKGFVGKPFTQEKLIQYINKSPFIQAKQQKQKETAHGNLVH